MALSDKEKAANKAANKIRDRAYNQRRKAFRDALEASEQSPSVLAAREAADAADAAFERHIASRDAEIANLRAQVEALEARIAAIYKTPEFDELKASRSSAFANFNKVRDEAHKKVEAQYPDLAGNAAFYVAAWTPPPEVKEAMESARVSPEEVARPRQRG